MSGDSNHYSYVAYADRDMAERFDRVRFGGPIGTLLLEEQERILREFLGDLTNRTVIDVGTGTGRAALAVARWGAQVVGVDASPEMLAMARKRAQEAGLSVTFALDDAHDLPFPAGAFDHAVSLRLLMHTPDWRRCLGELCRVSRRRVVIDFPAFVSMAALQALTRSAIHGLGLGNRRSRIRRDPVQAYRVLRLRAVCHELERHGFRLQGVHRQFVLPIALHKLAGSRRLTLHVERLLAGAGLLRLMGSPVTIVAERCTS